MQELQLELSDVTINSCITAFGFSGRWFEAMQFWKESVHRTRQQLVLRYNALVMAAMRLGWVVGKLVSKVKASSPSLLHHLSQDHLHSAMTPLATMRALDLIVVPIYSVICHPDHPAFLSCSGHPAVCSNPVVHSRVIQQRCGKRLRPATSSNMQ